MNQVLNLTQFIREASIFSSQESTHAEPSLFGVTDGKAVGTYLEHKFTKYLQSRYQFQAGNSANGIDFPSLNIDMKVTSRRQPQSSCPFRSARQKVYGLGYALIVFVYEKEDNTYSQTSLLKITDTIFINAEQTADYQTTRGLIEIISRNGNHDDVAAFLIDRNLPVDDITLNNLASEILTTPPQLGYLTISNALQWRLQYSRAIEQAGSGSASGLFSIFKA